MRPVCPQRLGLLPRDPWLGSRGPGSLVNMLSQNPDKKKHEFNTDFSLNQLIIFFINFYSIVSSSPRNECSDSADKDQTCSGGQSILAGVRTEEERRAQMLLLGGVEGSVTVARNRFFQPLSG